MPQNPNYGVDVSLDERWHKLGY